MCSRYTRIEFDATAEELAESIKAVAKYNNHDDKIEIGICSGQGWCHIETQGYRNVYYDY